MDTRERWIRGLYMILFLIIGYILKFLVFLITAVQFLSSIIFEQPNPQLQAFGLSLSNYAYEIIRYLTYNTEQKPYPFDAWPGEKSSNKNIYKP